MKIKEFLELFSEIDNKDQEVMILSEGKNCDIQEIVKSWDVFYGDIIIIKSV